MPKRLTERYNVDEIRFTRADPREPLGRDLLGFVDAILPDGSVFHVLRDIPDDSGDEMTILVDGSAVIHFELPRLHFREPRMVGGPPCDVRIETLSDFRKRSGQGRHRILLDRAVADALQRQNLNGS